jgi:NAD(P)-dependent dehydrogenase (short-subunit alcohol dehydrogenase family)
MIEEVASTHGRLDILVNNAGITRDNLLLRMSDEEFDEVILVNLRSAFVACRAAARPMMRGRFGESSTSARSRVSSATAVRRIMLPPRPGWSG